MHCNNGQKVVLAMLNSHDSVPAISNILNTMDELHIAVYSLVRYFTVKQLHESYVRSQSSFCGMGIHPLGHLQAKLS